MSQQDCLFCRIVRGEIPANFVHRGDGVSAFRDINPQAKVHIVIIPDQHLDGALDVTVAHEQIAGRLFRVAAEVARAEGIAESGYRLIVNQGRDGGQSVGHLHMHLLGGQPLRVPLV